MILTAHQPVYLPWLGLFDKIMQADLFCYFDIVQYQTRDFNNRNKIKTPQGEIWLSVPVESKNHFQKDIGDIKIIPQNWAKKHFKSISLAYQKAPYFHEYIQGLETLYLRHSYETLSDLNWVMLQWFLKALNITTPVVKASDYDFVGEKSDLVLDMCVKLKASQYIFGAQGKNYADVQAFRKKGVTVFFQDYQHPTYQQLHGAFLPYMSILDLLFNEGPASAEVLYTSQPISCE